MGTGVLLLLDEEEEEERVGRGLGLAKERGRGSVVGVLAALVVVLVVVLLVVAVVEEEEVVEFFGEEVELLFMVGVFQCGVDGIFLMVLQAGGGLGIDLWMWGFSGGKIRGLRCAAAACG